jgi:hypothetical protein
MSIVYVYILIFISYVKSNCGHDELYNSIGKSYEEYHLRDLQSVDITKNILALKNNTENFKPIRIRNLYINATNINRNFFPNYYINVTTMTTEALKVFEKEILEPNRILLEKIIKVFPYSMRIYLSDQLCAYTEPTEYYFGIRNYDVVFTYSFEYSEQNFRARSQPCFLGRSVYNRPLTGMVYINTRLINPTASTPEERELIRLTLLHEYIHILGFSPFLYSMFIDEDGNPTQVYLKTNFLGTDVPFLSSNKLTEFTKEYFNCTKVPGMVLEKNGVTGTSYAHWSRTILQNELMTGSSAYNYRQLTNFTLKLLDDTGWYAIDFSFAEKTIWGRNKGCDFFTQKCTDFAEYCTKLDKYGCDYNYNFLSICMNDGLSSCPYNYGFQNCTSIYNINEQNRQVTQNLNRQYPYNVYAGLSKCLMSSYKNSDYLPRCHRVTCDTEFKNVKIYLEESSRIKSVTCGFAEANEHKTILDFYGNNITFRCPYYTRMCFDQDDDITGAFDSTESSFYKIYSILVVIAILIIY